MDMKLKFATTLYLILNIVVVSTTMPAAAQAQADQGKPQAEKTQELKKVFEKETVKFKADSAEFDPVKADRENAQQQAQKKGWSNTKKTLVIAAVAVGVAGLLFLLIKYGKECLRTDPANCRLGVDEICVCLEYERRNP